MNYLHAFHAGNHADVLKHVVVLAICDALTAKPAACFALDTHAGAGVYALDDARTAARTGEAREGIDRVPGGVNALLDRYVGAVAACRAVHGARTYPGSPWLLQHALREQDRIVCCELVPDVAATLSQTMAADARVNVQACEGYSALKALLPPRDGRTRLARGLVLIDPPYETQQVEFTIARTALATGLARWPQGCFAFWYPVKTRRTLQPAYRRFAKLEARNVLRVELLVRADDSPLRMNGSGLIICNAPWQLETRLAPAIGVLAQALGSPGQARIDWLRAPS